MKLSKHHSGNFLLALAATALIGCGGSSGSLQQLNGTWSGNSVALCPEEVPFSALTEAKIAGGDLTEFYCDSEPLGVTGQFSQQENGVFAVDFSTGESGGFYTDGDHAALLVNFGDDGYGLGVLQRGGMVRIPTESDMVGKWVGRTITIDEDSNPASVAYASMEVFAPLTVGPYEFEGQTESGNSFGGIIARQADGVFWFLTREAPDDGQLYLLPTYDGLFAGSVITRQDDEGGEIIEKWGFWEKQ